MINGIQIRMARAAVKMNVRELAEEAGINPNTITRLEIGRGIQASSLEKIEAVLRKHGAVFIPENGIFSGVGLTMSKHDKLKEADEKEDLKRKAEEAEKRKAANK